MSQNAKRTSAGRDRLEKALNLSELSPAERQKLQARLYAPPPVRKPEKK